jgi:hypothetical protein
VATNKRLEESNKCKEHYIYAAAYSWKVKIYANSKIIPTYKFHNINIPGQVASTPGWYLVIGVVYSSSVLTNTNVSFKSGNYTT